MSIDLIKKEDSYLSYNNLILTHYEILGDNDIYFLKIRIKNTSKATNNTIPLAIRSFFTFMYPLSY